MATKAKDDQTEEYANFPGESVQDVLADDVQLADPVYLETSYEFLGDQDIPTERYYDYDWHRQEVEKVWKKTWQVACREEEIPNPGDYYVYDVADDSVIVCRTSDGELKAYVNACLHRGNALCTGKGSKKNFRCPYHGYTWNLEGKLKWIPAQWDFPHVDKSEFGLPELPIESWGGFIFINLDENCGPLSEYLEILPEHIDADELANRYKAAHVSQVVPCNWKIAQEAFIEGYHVAETHFEKDENFEVKADTIAASNCDTEIQYDIWPGIKHITRLVQLSGVPSGYVAHKLKGEQEIIDVMLRALPEDMRPKLGEGQKARPALAEFNRKALGARYKTDLSDISDSAALDQIQYTIFPNFTIWPAVASPLIYRFRPYGDDPNQSLFEIWFLFPKPGDGSEYTVAEERRLGPDELWADVPELGPYGPIVDQDIPNLGTLQKGIRTLRKGLTLGNYQEVRIRHFHKTLEEYLDAD